MGTDIHGLVEVKTKNGWVCVNTLSSHHNPMNSEESMLGYSSPVTTSRNYARFAKLAGVRGPGPDPRGLPEDVSDTGRLLSDVWGADGHSHSWVDLKTASEIFLQTHSGEENEWITKYPESYFFNYELSREFPLDTHARFVFWFDN